jgi:hypothetical protein
MTTLTINDLSRNEEMDRDGMAGVRGGDSQLAPGEPYPYAYKLDQILKLLPDAVRPWSGPIRVDLPASL